MIRQHLRLIHSRSEAPDVTREEHDRQRRLVEASMYRSDRSQERRDEARAYARVYPLAARQVQAVQINPPVDPRPAA